MPGSTTMRDAAGFGELDGVAGKIDQHLAQPRGIADHGRRQPLVDIGRDFEPLGLRARRQQFDHLLDHAGQRERARLEIERPASILEKSRISSISESSVSPDVFTAFA